MNNQQDKPISLSYQDALAFLYKTIDYEKLISFQYNASTFSLDRMKKLLAYIGNPHIGLPCIHITGTKGKGSTAIMTATVMECAGLITGLFTSPHLIDLKERIQINRQKIPEAEFASIMHELQPYIRHLQETEPSASPTFFEILTAISMVYFKRKRTEMAVLEVGLGGRLDSTNVVVPMVSIITNVGLDHTAILGNSLSSIAYEKAGIIKHRVPVVSGIDSAEALSVIENTCREKDAPLYLFGRDIRVEAVKHLVKDGTQGMRCMIKTWRGSYDNIYLPLVGIHQAKNCALVLGTFEILREQDNLAVNPDIIREALASIHCPARIEVVAKNPTIILDFAHTADSMRFLKETLIGNFTFRRLILILGFSQDKDLNNILKEIVMEADSIIITRSKNPRAAPPEDLYEKITKLYGKHPDTANTVQSAITMAKQMASKEDMICITGSAYVAGEARQALDT
ncbi:Folylpolyglutamate synthase [Candidatus Brocadiaceae bacterium B188]|nr:bifunctional folylpolyglutamate synthase/dihydrofolate synthase [Candidatus Brocadia sapporoensis]QQR65844.1 MAG: bifunctional folylpolyglutamate synthase/dihydrofolate synthase [Candidatus Brocadia sp.]RZV59657.1 MAG: bifunctional folylpolyglutamate synthase/dihydrofolate synthase [Candidatus Brocadia sp. BROELEC01]TWU50178.1 Folylpolyglutamate synthase [Candidatus Brocadiaceae bacterium B188]